MSELRDRSRPLHRAGPQGGQINVLVAHADAIVSAGLAALLATQSDLNIVTATDDSADADVIIFDYHSAMAHARRWPPAHQRRSLSRVLIVTQLDREWEVYSAMTVGVHGYLLQNADIEQLLVAVRMLSRGKHYLSAELSRCVTDGVTRIGLTNRETDVLHLLAQGQCNKSIARQLGIGVATVKTHVRGVCDKLGATARTHAVVLAMRRGLVELAHAG